MDFLEDIFWFFEDIFESIGWFIEDLMYELDLEDLFYSLTGGMSLVMIMAIFGIVFLFFGVIAIGIYVLNAVAISKFSKKLGHNTNTGLAWIPFLQGIFVIYLLSKASGRNDFRIDPKIDEKFKIQDRNTSFLYYVLVYFLGTAVATTVSSIVGFILGLIPFVGVILSPLVGFVIGLIPAAAMGIFKFVYLRDCLDLLKEDKNTNKTTAIIITIADHFIGLVLPIYLLTLLKCDPLPVNHAPYEEYEQYGYDPNGYNSNGYNPEGYNQYGYAPEGYEQNTYQNNGYDPNNYNNIQGNEQPPYQQF